MNVTIQISQNLTLLSTFRVFLAASTILNLQNEMRLWSLRGQAHYPCRINFGISQQLWAR